LTDPGQLRGKRIATPQLGNKQDVAGDRGGQRGTAYPADGGFGRAGGADR